MDIECDDREIDYIIEELSACRRDLMSTPKDVLINRFRVADKIDTARSMAILMTDRLPTACKTCSLKKRLKAEHQINSMEDVIGKVRSMRDEAIGRLMSSGSPKDATLYKIYRRCGNKRPYLSEYDAINAMNKLKRKSDFPDLLNVYHCVHCSNWHVGHRRPQTEEANDHLQIKV